MRTKIECVIASTISSRALNLPEMVTALPAVRVLLGLRQSGPLSLTVPNDAVRIWSKLPCFKVDGSFRFPWRSCVGTLGRERNSFVALPAW